jgi:hypothetical protein
VQLTWAHTHINPWSKSDTGGNKWPSHLIATWVFPWLLVFQGVCGCACALFCMQYLCFLEFYVLFSVQWLGQLLPPVSDLLQGFMCVRAQLSCSVVSNWPLCDFCGRVYWDILYIFLIPQFCLFLRHQTMDKVQKHNTFKVVFNCYPGQNRTESKFSTKRNDLNSEWIHPSIDFIYFWSLEHVQLCILNWYVFIWKVYFLI